MGGASYFLIECISSVSVGKHFKGHLLKVIYLASSMTGPTHNPPVYLHVINYTEKQCPD